MRALAENGRDGRVASAMEPVVETVDASDMLEGAVQRLHAGRVELLPVLRGAKLVGILTADNVTEFLMIESALRARGAKARSPGTRAPLKGAAMGNAR
jgi:CBS-domain-containing membrane protein